MQEFWQKISQYKKWIVLGLVIVVGAWGGMTYYSKTSKPVFTGTTMAVERGDIIATVAATGTIAAVNSVDVSSRITGLITEVKVHENDMVKADQVLVVLDDTSARSQVDQARAQMVNTSANYERSRQLAAIGGESLQQLDADRTNYDVAKATYDNVASQLGYTIITAPIDGLVIGKPIPAGQTVAPGISNPMVLLTVADLSKMQIQGQVDESDIGRVKLGQTVDFTVDAYPGKTFTGVVSLISQKAVIQSNVVYYTVYVDVDSPQGLLFPTMTARVAIKVGESKNTLVIPLSAVKEVKGQKTVQVMVEGKTQTLPVQLGLSDDEKTEILAGIKEGDQIVLPAAKAAAGAQSQPAAGGNPMRGLR
ncbi:MAG: efflux RND transporter periplasmic adaptor subunit [Negativicutes bacterium]|nr:efflux RND transporter periplasmic adaptor subunit [Negativicutes bacterium]